MNEFVAAGAAPAFFAEVVWLVVAGAAIAYVCHRLRLMPIIGFLLAGVAIGPNALGLVRNRDVVDAAAEVGVILLLFIIGIEFNLDKLAKIKRLIFLGGGLQVGLAALATFALLAALGVGWRDGVFTGLLVALSSTAIVLKLLADRGETGSTHGQVVLGLLIFQDLAVVAVVLLVPMLGGTGGSLGDVALGLAKAVAIIVAVLVFARRLMPKVLELVGRTCSQELFLLTVVAVCFGTAYLTSLVGVSLSLGAFLAGLLVSESRYSQHALGEILPLQILFSATFFVSVGMLLDLSFLAANAATVAAAIAVVVVVKLVTTAASAVALGYGRTVVTVAAFMLAQIGEFSFVLERTGREAGLSVAGLGESGTQAFIAAAVVLMIMTPFLSDAGGRLGRLLGTRAEERMREAAPVAHASPELEALEDHVVVAGYGGSARQLVRVLRGSGVPFVITTLSPEGASEAEAAGLPVILGDASRQHTLSLAKAELAKMLVVADDEPAMAHRIEAVARTLNPTMRIVVRTRYISEIEPLRHAGADRVVSEELESIVALFHEVLLDYRVAPGEMDRYEEAIRRDGYAALLDEAPRAEPVVVCELGEDCLDTRTVTVRDGAPAAGRSLAELGLDAAGVEVRAVTRDDGEAVAPSTDAVLRPGDELVLAGGTALFARVAPLFRPARAPGGVAGEETGPAGGTEGRDGVGASGTRGAAYVDTESVVELRPAPDAARVCSHIGQTRPVHPSARGCEECLRSGDAWVHLRLCMTCGHVGCCDTSKNKHATAHHRSAGHPIVRSLEPGETWGWCYDDEEFVA